MGLLQAPGWVAPEWAAPGSAVLASGVRERQQRQEIRRTRLTYCHRLIAAHELLHRVHAASASHHSINSSHAQTVTSLMVISAEVNLKVTAQTRDTV